MKETFRPFLFFVFIALVRGTENSGEILQKLKALEEELEDVKTNLREVKNENVEIKALFHKAQSPKDDSCNCDLTQINSDIHELLKDNLEQKVQINLLFHADDDFQIELDSRFQAFEDKVDSKYSELVAKDEELSNADFSLKEDLDNTESKVSKLHEDMETADAKLQDDMQSSDAILRAEMQNSDARLKEEMDATDAEIKKEIKTMTHLIRMKGTATFNDCFGDCKKEESCKIFSWYEGSAIGASAFKCHLFSSDEGFDPCPWGKKGCLVGEKDSGFLCFNVPYNVLREGSRNVLTGPGYSNDWTDCEYVSGDWHGEGWYAISSTAGTKLRDKFVPYAGHCQTQRPGWLATGHPKKIGSIVDGRVCFSIWNDSGASESCISYTNVKIRHCGSHYLYYLPNVDHCWARYCTE